MMIYFLRKNENSSKLQNMSEVQLSVIIYDHSNEALVQARIIAEIQGNWGQAYTYVSHQKIWSSDTCTCAMFIVIGEINQ